MNATVTPAFCAACCEERRGLEPRERPGVNGKLRTVYLCVDCVELGELADLKQHDLRDEKQGRFFGRQDGGSRHARVK